MADRWIDPRTWTTGDLVRRPYLILWVLLLGYLKKRLMPVGTTRFWLTATPPTNWLIQSGQVVNRATYPALFAKYGTTYNTGGETGSQFRLPNCEGKYFVGASATKVLASTGGAAMMLLLTTHIPSHVHSGPLHTHNVTTDIFMANSFTPDVTFKAPVIVDNGTDGEPTSEVSGGATGSTGGGDPFDLAPPRLAAHVIVKAL